MEQPQTWVQIIAEVVAEERGNQSRAARRIGVHPQDVGRWLRGTRPKMPHMVKVARATKYSLPYLIAVVYDIPLGEMAAGAGADLLGLDGDLAEERNHIARQYGILRRLAEAEQRLAEYERAKESPPDQPS